MKTCVRGAKGKIERMKLNGKMNTIRFARPGSCAFSFTKGNTKQMKEFGLQALIQKFIRQITKV